MIAEAIFQSKLRYGISVYSIPKFEFNNLEQAMDPNISKLQVIQNDMMRLLIGTNRSSHTNMEKLRQQLRMMSVNQLSVYHVAIEMYNIINNKSSESLHEEMKYEPRGYGLRGLEDGKVRVPNKAQWGESFFKHLCFAIVIVFWLKWAGYLAVAGLNPLPLLSDRVSPFGV